MSLPSFTLLSTSTNGATPFSLGHVFKKGDVPAGSQVVASTSDFQCVPKNVWSDGSLKFAILSGRASLTANTALPIQLSIGTPAAGVDMTPTYLNAMNLVAQIGCGAFGTVTWSGTDWNTPFQTWVTGPRMGSWVYRKPVGTDPHLVAWIEVRLWAGGEVEILPWVENGYLRVAAPTNKVATYTFTLGGTQRCSVAIDLKHHQRTPIINGAALSYWLGTDNTTSVMNDSTYMQASELVPTYFASVPHAASVVTVQPSTYTPLQQGRYTYDGDAMGAFGYQTPIGLLPEHDVLYLVADPADRPAVYASMIRNGFSAGRYAIHYRDETTNRPPKFSSYPTLNINDTSFKDTGGSTTGTYTPTPTGTAPPQWDVSHSPSVGYLAYLVTGRWYFMEEVQFATTANYLGNGDSAALRNGSQGLVKPENGAWQTRSCAWDWRARVQALCVTPDNDTALRNEFINSVEANITYFYNKYIASTNNPWGFIKPGGFYDSATGGHREEAPWMQDFVVAAFGWSISMDLPIDSTKKTQLSNFFQWKAKSTILRLGPSTGFWYINAAAYTMVISPVSSPDWDGGTGPWFTTEADIYYNSYHGTTQYPTPPSWYGNTEGVLNGEYAIDYWPTTMWGNLMPAIAYAVRHNVPGALAGYNRILNASNFNTLKAEFNTIPVWSVAPATTSGASSVTFAQTRSTLMGRLHSNRTTVSKYHGRGIPKSAVATGFTNPSLIEPYISGDTSAMIYGLQVTPPTNGTMTLYEDSSFSYSGPDGSNDASFTLTKFGVSDTGTASFVMGTPNAVVTPAQTAKTITINLIDPNNVAQANLTNLKWALFAESTPDLFGAPVLKGAVESTNSAGELVVDVTPLQTVPRTYWLIVTNSDGTVSQNPPAQAFSGPVQAV